MSNENILVDARGKSCPEPVVLTRKALESLSGEELEVMVDSPVAKENVNRMVKNQGFQVTIQEEEGIFRLVIKK